MCLCVFMIPSRDESRDFPMCQQVRLYECTMDQELERIQRANYVTSALRASGQPADVAVTASAGGLHGRDLDVVA